MTTLGTSFPGPYLCNVLPVWFPSLLIDSPINTTSLSVVFCFVQELRFHVPQKNYFLLISNHHQCPLHCSFTALSSFPFGPARHLAHRLPNMLRTLSYFPLSTFFLASSSVLCDSKLHQLIPYFVSVLLEQVQTVVIWAPSRFSHKGDRSIVSFLHSTFSLASSTANSPSTCRHISFRNISYLFTSVVLQ